MLSRLITQGTRLFGTIADVETTATSSEQVGNTFVKTTRYLKQSYDSTGSVFKFTFWGWVAGMPVYNGLMTFNAGNSALNNYRDNHGININAESKVVYETCKATMYRELPSSFLWPGTIISNCAPFLVTWVNKPPAETNTSSTQTNTSSAQTNERPLQQGEE